MESEIDACIARFGSSDWTFLTDLCFEITSLSVSLKDSRAEFESNTVQPILHLRDDLEFWMKENREKLILGIAVEEHQTVQGVAQSVQQQQGFVMEQLEKQKIAFESEIDNTMAELGIEHVDVKFPHVLSGIPDEACDFYCYDNDLKGNCLAEFHNLDYKHELHFQFLEEKYADAIKRAPTGGWTVSDHFAFQHILEQYADEKHDKRLLYIDRMTRQFKQKSRSDIVQHEDWWFAFKSFQNQFRDQLYSWQRDRDDLFLKIKAILSEANTAYEAEKERVADRRKQEQICNKWHEKVKIFQQQKSEMMKLEASVRAKMEEEEMKQRRREEQKEKDRRSKLKSKIEKYHEEKQMQHQLEIDNDRRRLAELQARAEEQRALDRERVEFRERLIHERNEQMLMEKERMEEMEREKEERLEKLRMQVRVEAADDPGRLLEPTEAYKLKQAAKEDEEKELQEPLFPLHTFNMNQVNSDQRLKTENALRKAGLHKSDYARQVLSKIAPPTVPRKDTTSTIFK
eukprot:gene3646-4163_t